MVKRGINNPSNISIPYRPSKFYFNGHAGSLILITIIVRRVSIIFISCQPSSSINFCYKGCQQSTIFQYFPIPTESINYQPSSPYQWMVMRVVNIHRHQYSWCLWYLTLGHLILKYLLPLQPLKTFLWL